MRANKTFYHTRQLATVRPGKYLQKYINHTRLAFLGLILRTLEHFVFYNNKPYINQVCLSWPLFFTWVKISMRLENESWRKIRSWHRGLTQSTRVTDADSRSNCTDGTKEQTKFYTSPMGQKLLCVRRRAFSNVHNVHVPSYGTFGDMKLSNKKFFLKNLSVTHLFIFLIVS